MTAESVRCESEGHDRPAEIRLSLLASVSHDAIAFACWDCAMAVLRDWHANVEEWSDAPGWIVERLIDDCQEAPDGG